jgi:hypothetical protein
VARGGLVMRLVPRQQRRRVGVLTTLLHASG